MVLLDVSNIFTVFCMTRICSALRTVTGQDQSEMPSQREEALPVGRAFVEELVNRTVDDCAVKWRGRVARIDQSGRADVGTYFYGRFWQGYQRQDDSTAALGIVLSGLGRTRHVRVQYLLIQRRVCLPKSQRNLRRNLAFAEVVVDQI